MILKFIWFLTFSLFPDDFADHFAPTIHQNWSCLPSRSERLLEKGCALFKDSQWNENASNAQHFFKTSFVFFQGVQKIVFLSNEERKFSTESKRNKKVGLCVRQIQSNHHPFHVFGFEWEKTKRVATDAVGNSFRIFLEAIKQHRIDSWVVWVYD